MGKSRELAKEIDTTSFPGEIKTGQGLFTWAPARPYGGVNRRAEAEILIPRNRALSLIRIFWFRFLNISPPKCLFCYIQRGNPPMRFLIKKSIEIVRQQFHTSI